MPMTRLARTHLVYQCIILALVFMGISYYDFLLERKYELFLAFIPLFLCQLMILGCCMELFPLPQWMNLGQLLDASDGQVNTTPPEERQVEMVDKSVETLSSLENECMQGRTYKMRNWRSVGAKHKFMAMQSQPSNASNLSLIPLANKGGDFIFGHLNSKEQQNAEPTKKYYFPYREKRLERCIESEGNDRPYKIASWESRESDDLIENDKEPTSRKSESTYSEFSPSQSEMTKSYSFPFRHKRLQEWADMKESSKQESAECQTPYWKIPASTVTPKESTRCRKSRSSFHLNEDLQGSNLFKDFTRSLELAPDSSEERSSQKAPFTSLNKMRAGLSNYFTKIKRTNSKPKSCTESKIKKRSFRSLFQSKENLHTGSFNDKNRNLKRLESEDSSSQFHTGYIYCANDSFDKDVQKSISELSKAQT